MKILADESGATAIEYALVAGFVSIIIVTGVTTIGTKVSTFFTAVATNLR